MKMKIANSFKWAATIVILIGAVLTSLNVYPYSAIALNSGAFLYLIWSLLIKDLAMIIVNAGLLAIYTVGLAIKLL